MPAYFRSKFRHLFLILNSLAVLLFLLACANSFLHPGRWWLISLLGLAFPYLLVLVVVFLLVALFMRPFRRWSLLSFAALLIGWSNIRHCLAMHPGTPYREDRQTDGSGQSGTTLRILTWNVRSFDDFVTKKAASCPIAGCKCSNSSAGSRLMSSVSRNFMNH